MLMNIARAGQAYWIILESLRNRCIPAAAPAAGLVTQYLSQPSPGPKAGCSLIAAAKFRLPGPS